MLVFKAMPLAIAGLALSAVSQVAAAAVFALLFLDCACERLIGVMGWAEEQCMRACQSFYVCI